VCTLIPIARCMAKGYHAVYTPRFRGSLSAMDAMRMDAFRPQPAGR